MIDTPTNTSGSRHTSPSPDALAGAAACFGLAAPPRPWVDAAHLGEPGRFAEALSPSRVASEATRLGMEGETIRRLVEAAERIERSDDLRLAASLVSALIFDDRLAAIGADSSATPPTDAGRLTLSPGAPLRNVRDGAPTAAVGATGHGDTATSEGADGGNPGAGNPETHAAPSAAGAGDTPERDDSQRESVPALFYAVLCVAQTPSLLNRQAKRGIPQDETIALLGDIERWIDDYRNRHGTWGFDKIGWLKLHFRERLVQIGRLQYEPTTFEWPFVIIGGPGGGTPKAIVEGGCPVRADGRFVGTDAGSRFPPGDIDQSESFRTTLEETPTAVVGHVVRPDATIPPEATRVEKGASTTVARRGDPAFAVHVPAGGSLHPDAIAASLREARAKLPRYYPDHPASLFVCDSWLLDPALGEYLGPDANIVRFQRRFTLIPMEKADDHQHIERLFPHGIDDIDTVSCGSTLQRAFVERVRSGGGWRKTAGVIPV